MHVKRPQLQWQRISRCVNNGANLPRPRALLLHRGCQRVDGRFEQQAASTPARDLELGQQLVDSGHTGAA